MHSFAYVSCGNEIMLHQSGRLYFDTSETCDELDEFVTCKHAQLITVMHMYIASRL